MKKNALFFVFLLTTILSVFIFYFPTIFFAIKSFDEVTPFKETHLPVCFSLSEMFDLISLLGLHQYFEASNTLYSSIISLRSNPLGDFLVLLTQFFCRKNPVNYHLYSLILHLISSCFIFLILNKISIDFELNNKIRLATISLLTFLWATHPVNIESVLLLTNYNAVLSYSLCIITIFVYLSYHSNQTIRTLLLCIPFSIATFSAEYLFTLPFVLFAYTFGESKDWKKSISQTFPLFIISAIFVISFIFSSSKINFYNQSFLLTLERVLWFAPQVLFHLISLLFFPLKLSIDQAFFVRFGESLFSPYAIFCVGTILILIICSLISLFNSKKRLPFLFIVFIPFLLSLLPFSHVFAPIYNIASERYLYLPSFIFILGLSNLIFYFLKDKKTKPSILVLSLLALITLLYSSRAYVRTLDWKDSFTLYESAINATNNPLYKAFRYKLLIPQEKIFSKFEHQEVSPIYQLLAIDNLELAIKDLKEKTKQHEKDIPLIIKSYGLDPETLLVKAAYLLAHSNYTINKDPQKAINILSPFLRELSLLDNAGLAFYASLHFFNNSLNKAEEILRYAHSKYPYSTRITFPLCQLIYMKTGNLDEVESFSLTTFKYFPYDTFTLLYLIKIYMLKKDNEKYAFYSYAYGLRHHSIESLQAAKNTYLMLDKSEVAKKIEAEIQLLQAKLSKKSMK